MGGYALSLSSRPYVLGITGTYCSGKSTLGKLLADSLEPQQVLHIEVDHLGHEALENQKDAVVQRFGKEILTDRDHTIDRKILGSIVFQNPAGLADLEAIVHPAMIARVESLIASFTGELVILNAAILHKMGLHRHCHGIWFVDAPVLFRLFRAMKRDALSIASAYRRISHQKSILTQLPRRYADIRRVSNWGGKWFLRRKLVNLIRTALENNQGVGN